MSTQRIVTIQAGEISNAAAGRTYRELEVLAFEAYSVSNYRAAHIFCMAAALVATSTAEEDAALEGAGEALAMATTYQPDPLPLVAEVPATIIPVVIDWGIPVYSGNNPMPIYGAAPVGASWRRPTTRP